MNASWESQYGYRPDRINRDGTPSPRVQAIMDATSLYIKLWKVLKKPAVQLYKKIVLELIQLVPDSSKWLPFLQFVSRMCTTKDSVDGFVPSSEQRSDDVFYMTLLQGTTKQELLEFLETFEKEFRKIPEVMEWLVQHSILMETTPTSTSSTIAVGTLPAVKTGFYEERPLKRGRESIIVSPRTSSPIGGRTSSIISLDGGDSKLL